MLTSVELAHTIGVISISVLADIYTTRVPVLLSDPLGISYSLEKRITFSYSRFCCVYWSKPKIQ